MALCCDSNDECHLAESFCNIDNELYMFCDECVSYRTDSYTTCNALNNQESKNNCEAVCGRGDDHGVSDCSSHRCRSPGLFGSDDCWAGTAFEACSCSEGGAVETGET